MTRPKPCKKLKAEWRLQISLSSQYKSNKFSVTSSLLPGKVALTIRRQLSPYKLTTLHTTLHPNFSLFKVLPHSSLSAEQHLCFSTEGGTWVRTARSVLFPCATMGGHGHRRDLGDLAYDQQHNWWGLEYFLLKVTQALSTAGHLLCPAHNSSSVPKHWREEALRSRDPSWILTSLCQPTGWLNSGHCFSLKERLLSLIWQE